jgi:signal transduction histidine kinase
MKKKVMMDTVKKHRKTLSLQVKLTIYVTLVLALCVLLSLGIDALLRYVIFQNREIPVVVDLVLISVFVGVLVTGILSRMFFDPIKKLNEAVKQVSSGDFDVNVETRSSAKEVRELYKGFNLMTHELRSTEILQTDFVSNVSHEFKTPINAIEGYAMLLQDCENLNDEQRQYVEKIILNTERLSSLAGNILLLSKKYTAFQAAFGAGELVTMMVGAALAMVFTFSGVFAMPTAPLALLQLLVCGFLYIKSALTFRTGKNR